MQLLPTWDLWYPSSPKHQLASAPALALCTKCWWRVWRNAAIQVPARLLVACLTRKLSLAVYVKNGSHDPILPQICVACPRMPRAKGDTIMHPLSKCRRNRQHAASSKSVWNRSEISLKPINRSRSALSYGGFQLSNSDSEAPSMLLFGSETGLKLIGTTSPASDSDPCCYVSVMSVDT